MLHLVRLHISHYKLILLICLAPLCGAKAQQVISITDEKQQAIEDVLIAIFPPGQPKQYTTYTTSLSGSATVQLQIPAIVYIRKLGFIPIIDTIVSLKNAYHFQLKSAPGSNRDVVVTGQFEPGTTDKSVQRIKVIDRQRIIQQGAVSLKDILANELNIRISQDAVLGSQISMNGLSGQNVKILIDGIPVIGRMDGNIDLTQINLNNIARIEVIEGPMSVIYGTDALGGVINLITRQPDSKQLQLGVNGYYDNAGTYNTDGNINYQYKKLQASVSGGRNFFDGYNPLGDVHQRWMQWKPRTQYFADMQLRYRYKSHSHRILLQAFNEKITARNEPIVTPYTVTGFDDYFITSRLNAALHSDLYLRNHASLHLIQSYAHFNRTKNTYVKNLVTGNEQLTPNSEDHDTTSFSLFTFRGTYTTRRPKIWNTQTGYDINIEDGSGKRLSGNIRQIGDFALFYIADIKKGSRLNLRPGIRAIYNTSYRAPLIPSLNLRYAINEALTIRASYARGFRAPALKELSLFFVDVNHNIQGNPNLRAETSDNLMANIQYQWQHSKLTFKTDAGLFYNTIRDMISLALIDAATQLYSYVNIDHYKTTGVTANADVWYQGVHAALGYSRTGRYNQLSAGSHLPEFTYSNEYRINVTQAFSKLKADIGLFYKYNGVTPGYMLNAQNEVQTTSTQAYGMMDITAGKYFWQQRLRFTAGIKNLLDVGSINYSSAGGAHSSSQGSMPIAMGRLFFTSIRFNLEKI